MATVTQKSWARSTSGDTWQDLVPGAATVQAVTLANTSFGAARVSMRLLKGSTPYSIIPDDELPQGASYRFRNPSIVIEAGDKLQVKSVGGVDWIASGVQVTA